MGTLTPVADIIASVSDSAAAAAVSESNASASASAASLSALSAATSAGLFAPSTAVTDLNNYLESGIFIAGAPGSTIINVPPQVTGASATNAVFVTKIDSTRSIQRAYDINGVSSFERYFLSPLWSAWKPLANIGGAINVQNSIVQSIPNAVWTQSVYNTTVFNQNTADISLNAATGAITTPAWANFAKVTASVKFEAIAGDSVIRITKNGAAAAVPYDRRTLVAATETLLFTTSFIVTSGDLIAAQILQSSGAAINTQAYNTTMMVEFI